ncbi:MAG TPA: hypothetical protein ENK36_06460 [Desulfobacterales bacterium]|nr:hypothetical protein [Desulfobacterales bacterium]
MIKADVQLLKDFENQLDTSNPTGGRIPVKIIGYGEMSAIFLFDKMPELAVKRMPPFYNSQEISLYKSNINKYCRFLREKFNINTAPYYFIEIVNRYSEHILYIVQNRLDADSIGNNFIQDCSNEKLAIVLKAVLDKMILIWQWNRENKDMIFGLDGQISNWSFNFDTDNNIDPVYFDYTTPFIRKNGVELLDPEMFLKSCPSFLVWIVRWRFLQEVLDRYYDLRLVLIDLTANFHKEAQASKIPFAIEVINRYMDQNASDLKMQPITKLEVDKYYKDDAFIWKLFLSLRRLDCFIKTKIFRGKYDFILPGKIDR